MSTITRELSKPPVDAPSLDTVFFQPSEVELEFLKKTISTDDELLRQRVLEVQKDAYEEYPYPCIRAFHFICLMMRQNPTYTKVLQAANDAPKDDSLIFVDLGCCMGTDVRKLALDGYPVANIIGCDLRASYIALGRKLYQDSVDTLPIHFITGDILELPLSQRGAATKKPINQVTSLQDLRGRVTHFYAGALFHLFDEETQFAIAQRIVCLVSREKGVVIFGRHQGKEYAHLIADHLGRKRYGHSPTSWISMWKRVFTESDGKEFASARVEVIAELSTQTTLTGIPIEHRTLTWSVHL